MRHLLSRLLLLGVGLALSAATVFADDLEALAGKWSLTKTNEQGQPFQQTVEFKKGKFTFKIGAGSQVLLYAEGDIKTQAAGPLKVITFANIKAGQSADDAQDVNDDRAFAYRLDYGTLYLAGEFDRDRGQNPTVDVYRKVATPIQSLIIDKVVIEKIPQAGTWYFCLDATVEGTTKKFQSDSKGFNQSAVTIPVNLSLTNVKSGQKCSFVCRHDDVEGDVCSDDVDGKCEDSFTATESGSKTFKPEDGWQFTVHWHLK